MAYKTEDLLNQSLQAIEDNELLFIEDIVALLPCDKTTFYSHFPIESNELNEIKKKLDKNKIGKKIKLRNNFENSDNPTLQLALYKLIGTSEERKKLSSSYIDMTSKGESIGEKTQLTKEEIQKLIDKL